MPGLSDVVLLLARTSRSRAYVAALAEAGLSPGHVVLYGGAGAGRPATVDLAGPLGALGGPVTECPERSLVDPSLVAVLAATRPSLLVYSGYPSQLVPGEVLALAPVLHVHGGELPEYRGSTTVYYALLDGRRPAVTALLLDRQIDTGLVVASRRFDPPAPGTDVDRDYDDGIRAELLAHVLGELDRSGSLPVGRAQEGAGRLHFVVHPVLKQLALDSLRAPVAP